MSYFEDLTEYTYMSGKSQAGLVNVGWLDAEHEFPRGVVDEEIIERIWKFCCGRVIGTRGYHGCELCIGGAWGPPLWVTRGAESLCLGTGEIRVFGVDGRAYAAPDLIYHYVLDHGYVPPDEFILAVRQCPLPESKDYRKLLAHWAMDEKELLWSLSWQKDQIALRDWHVKSPRAEFWHYHVQFSAGDAISDSVVSEPVSGSASRVLCSPVFIEGLAEGDEIQLRKGTPGYRMEKRGPNVAGRVFFEGDIDEKQFLGAAQDAGGRVDGKAALRAGTVLVVTFPSERFREGFEEFVRKVKELYPMCKVFDLAGAVSTWKLYGDPD